MTTLLTLLTLHFIGDFLLQSDWMATNKSKRWDALALHVTCYVTPLFFALAVWSRFAHGQVGLRPIVWLVGVTWVAHFVTDAITSRATSALWFFKQEFGIWTQAEYAVPKHSRSLVNPWMPIGGKRHWFFVVIGFDQLLHIWQLGLTALWLGLAA